jgi:hypothetical protein
VQTAANNKEDYTDHVNLHVEQSATGYDGHRRGLGLCVSSNLKWKVQVRQQVSKAGKLLGYIRRNTMFMTDITPRRSLYLALVRSHFGYGSQIWAPQAIALINMLEKTQRRATKLILNFPFSTDVDYRTRLISLHLLPVSYWHEYLVLTLFFRITHGLVETSALPVIRVTHRTTRSSSNNTVKYVIRKSKTTTYQQSFFVVYGTDMLMNFISTRTALAFSKEFN